MLAQEIFFLILSFIDIIMVKLIFSLLIKKKPPTFEGYKYQWRLKG
jgi:hypothetical protein